MWITQLCNVCRWQAAEAGWELRSLARCSHPHSNGPLSSPCPAHDWWWTSACWTNVFATEFIDTQLNVMLMKCIHYTNSHTHIDIRMHVCVPYMYTSVWVWILFPGVYYKHIRSPIFPLISTLHTYTCYSFLIALSCFFNHYNVQKLFLSSVCCNTQFCTYGLTSILILKETVTY